jgi:hypothetical protein
MRGVVMKKYLTGLLVSWIALMPGSAQALGLSMRFVDITLENVEPGTTANLRVIRNLPLVLANQDAVHGTDVVVESVVPDAHEMKDGYEPIPDPTWIQIVPNRFHLGPKASASSDVIVQIPNDPKLMGKHYEAIIWAHTDPRKNAAPGTGVLIQAGLRSRIRISIGTMGPAALQKEKALKKLATINTNFSINPDNTFAQDVAVGTKVDLKASKKISLKIVNQSDDPIKLKLAAIQPDENIMPQSGYAYAPDPKWLTVSPGTVTVEGNAIKEIKLNVSIPDKPEYHGKKYMFLIRTTLADESLPLAYNNMVYISTLP